MSAQYTTNELMAAAVAREIANGDLVFIGVGTTDRAFTLAAASRVVATRLAQSAHAPDASIYWGNLISPDLDHMPQTWLQDTFTRWPCASQLTETSQKNDMLAFGRFDVSFESAAQVDRYGNLNITRLNHPDGSIKTRLIGCLAQPEHLAFVKKPIIMVDLKPAHLRGGRGLRDEPRSPAPWRAAAALRPARPGPATLHHGQGDLRLQGRGRRHAHPLAASGRDAGGGVRADGLRARGSRHACRNDPADRGGSGADPDEDRPKRTLLRV